MSAEIQKRLKAKIREAQGKNYGVPFSEMRRALYDAFVHKHGADAVGPLELYQRRVWTDEELIADAKRFDTRKAWQTGSAAAYSAALRRGILDLCCAHMKSPLRKRTDEELIADAKRFDTRKAWGTGSGSAYGAARKRGKEFFELCCAHMKSPLRKRTDEELIADAKRFDTRKAWETGSRPAYVAAYRRGKEFFDLCCAHMTKRVKKKA